MKKIISLFQRNYDGNRQVRDEIVPGAEWVTSGEGIATRKWDGTSCMVRDGILFRRYDAKNGKIPPANFEPCMEEADPNTGHLPGWVPVGNEPESRWHREAFKGTEENGTYELLGPKVQGNPEKFESHRLIPHGKEILTDAPRTFDALREYFSSHDVEGIVWWHPDGRMVKIKAKDFGIKRR